MEDTNWRITTLNLTKEQMAYLSKVKERTGTPLGFQIRKAIDQYITKEKRLARKKS